MERYRHGGALIFSAVHPCRCRLFVMFNKKRMFVTVETLFCMKIWDAPLVRGIQRVEAALPLAVPCMSGKEHGGKGNVELMNNKAQIGRSFLLNGGARLTA